MTTTTAQTERDFTEFYSANFHRIATQLYAYLGDHAEAQDLTQEAFCRAYDRWGQVSGYEQAGGWVRQVAWNLATSRLRHLQVALRHLAGQRPQHVGGPSPDRVAIQQALAKLPANHRLAVVLHHLGQLTTSEIAEQHGVAEGTVRSWLSRGRAQLAEELVDWEQTRKVPFQAQGVADVAARVKRRRAARRTALAAVVLALLVVPLVFVLQRGGGKPPVIGPTVAPTTSVSPTQSPLPASPEVRAVKVPGVSFTDLPTVSFVDAQHGWLSGSTCPSSSTCPPTLASTKDGGLTWQPVTLPELPEGASVATYFIDASTVTLAVTRFREDHPDHYLHSTDGGAHFGTHPASRPPTATVEHAQGRYAMLCPGATGLEDGAAGIECAQTELVRIGSGRLAHQPPWRGPSVWVHEGGDGRLWLTDETRQPKVLAVSADKGETWKQLTWPMGAGQLQLSPDGSQAWMTGEQGLLQLDGESWVQRHAQATTGPLLVGNGLWLLRDGGQTGFWQSGSFTALPGIGYDYGWVLRDGTIVLGSGRRTLLGVGSGVDRRWVAITV